MVWSAKYYGEKRVRVFVEREIWLRISIAKEDDSQRNAELTTN
jgi:hypothetical protein